MATEKACQKRDEGHVARQVPEKLANRGVSAAKDLCDEVPAHEQGEKGNHHDTSDAVEFLCLIHKVEHRASIALATAVWKTAVYL